MDFDWNPKPVPKCKNCGKDQGNHKAVTMQCPFGSSKNTRMWPTSYYPDKFYEPKKKGIK